MTIDEAASGMAPDVIEGYRLSPQQAARWNARAGDGPRRIEAMAVLEGELDPALLRRAVDEVRRAHEILRVSYRRLPGMRLPLQVVESDPVDGVLAYRLDGRQLHLSVSELAADAESMTYLAAEIVAAARALADGVEPGRPQLQYFPFAEWQHEVLDGEDAAQARAFWELQTGRLDLRPVLPGEPGESDQPGDGYEVAVVGAPVLAGLRAVAARSQADLSDLLLLLWGHLLARYTGQDEVVVGVELDGRVFTELTEAIGVFATSVPLRLAYPADEGVDEGLRRVVGVRATAAEWHEYAALAPRQAGAGFAWHPGAAVTIRSVHPPADSGCLTMRCRDAGDQLCVEMIFDPTAYPRSAVRRLLASVRALLADAAATSATGRRLRDLTIVADDQRQAPTGFADASGFSASGPAEATFPARFVGQAGRTPDAIAVRFAAETLTYARLELRSRELAGRLRAIGVATGQPVAISRSRSLETLVWIVAVLRAGGVYVPVDPADPPQRRAHILADCGATLVVTDDTIVDSEPVWSGIDAVRPGDAAYVIYTSGSTGRPKGVVIEHGSCASYLRWAAETLLPGVLIPAITRLTFDASLKQLLAPLVVGGEVWLLPDVATNDPALLYRSLAESAGRVAVNCVPSLWQSLLEHAEADPRRALAGRLARLFLGGERIPAPLLVRTAECFPDVEVWNLYGPTEATANAAAGRASESTDSIGRPIAGARLRILDERSRPVPVGVTGRLHIGGPGLARGYLGMPAQTADRFRPDPFGPAGSRLYDTGDQARCLPDGRIEFVGRRDLQVKVRGFRIELEGVEAALRDVSGVIDAAVAVAGDGARLVAYVVGDPTCTAARLHTELTRVLPTYSVPADFFAVAALPRTATGKLDRLGLADVPVIDREQPGRSVGPLSPIEEQLAVIWARLLEVDGVRANDSFFALGGHSLLVIRLMARVRDAFGVDLVPQTVFETPLLRDFAGRVEQALRERRGVALPPLVPVRREEELPLSFAQQRLWILDRLEPGNPRYNVVAGRRVRGPLDLDAARRAVAGIVRRHEVLRTAFTLGADGQPRQTVLGSVEVALPVREVAGEDELLRFAAEQAHLAFDLAEPPLLRMSVARLSSDDAVLVLVLHHIVCDGFAKAIFYADFVQLYRAYATGGPASLDDLPVQYPDYAVWQRGWLTGDLLDRQVGYWRERLRGLTPLELPTDRPRPAVAAYRGATVTHALTPALTRAVRELALGHNATLFMAVLAGFVTVLGRHAGSHDIAVGTPVANRSHSELEQLIGFFVNTVVLRTDLSGDPSFAELLARVRAGGIDAYANADVPFERLVEELAPQRSRARSPLFQVLVANIPPDQPELRLTEGSVLAPVELESGAAMFDLTLSIMDDGDRLWLFGNYDLDLFTAATVRGLLRHLSTLLGGAVADPSRRISALPLVAGADRDAVLAAGTPTVGAPLDERCLHQLVRDQAAATPGAVALADHAREWTYAQVDASGDALAQRLADAGAGLEDRVLVGVSHSVNLIVALLGVLKSGAVYVPVDPALAEERVAAVLAASGPVVVLCDPGGTTLWRRMGFVGPVLEVPGEPRAGRPVDRGVTPANAAYVIYTSGTTGRPKGAVNTHAGLRNSLARLHDDVPLGPDDVVLTKTPSMFDVSLWELLWPLCHGARAVVAEPHTYLDPWQLARLVREHDVTTVQFVPSLVGAFLDVFLDARTGPVAALRRVLCIGEALPADLRDRFAAALPDVALYNLYGPAEAAVHVTAWRCDSDSGVVPIGPPIAGIRAHVLDEALHPVPFGVVGELYLGGVGLARGYLDAPDLTADKFIPDPFGPPGERLYATGDRAVARADGILEFRGRSDDEIKVRGIRVDARQIEVTLLADPAVAEAVVVARSAASGEQALVAYVVSMAGAEVDQQRLLGLLRAELPGGPLPAAVTVLPELPRLISGKLDRRALPEPQWTVERGDFTTPEEGWESGLAEIWSRVLGQVVGRDDDFFALGGHSLLMIQVVARVREALGAEISPHALTTAPRLRDFAVAVARASARQGAAVPIEPAARDRPPVLSFAQQRLWITDRMRPDVPLHQVIAARRVYGELDLGAVERAINAVIARHEVLRTGFPAVRGMPSVCIMVDVTAPIEYIDLRRLPGDEREQTLLAEINALAARPFDLTVAPLLRIGAIRLADAEWALVAVLHHIVCDAWSLDVLFADFAAYYADPDADLPALTTRYADYAAWQRARMSGPLAETRLAFWRAQLADLPQLELPTDRPRPSGRPAHRGARVRRVLDRAVLDGLREISRAHGASLFMTTLAGFAVALSRASGQTDFGVGVPATNRERVELERLIGCFANTLVLRMDVSGDPTFAELVDRVRATALAAYAHQDLPFDRLVEELAPVRGAATTAFVRVMLTFAADPGDPVRLPTARLHPMDVDGATALFDLRLLALEESDGLHLVLTYDRDLFDRTTADRLLAHLGELLGRVAAGHDERMSPVMPGPAVLSAPDHRGTPYLPALISANAGRRPHAPAVTCDGETVTYRELVERVNRLSQHLRADGVRAGELVGVYLNRSVDLVVAILGVLHSGAAYLPLDPAYPSRRTHAILADADPATVITTTELSADLPDPLRTVRIDRDADRIGAHQAGVPAGHVVHPDQTAYVIYTSGSTGTPKGVMVSHGQLLRSTQARTAYYRAPVDTFLLVSSLAFDSSVAGLFWTLADGGLLVLPPSEAHRDPKALARIVAEHAVTHTLMIGSWYRAMLDVADGGALGSLRVVIVAGEPLAPSLPTRHTAALPRAAFYNEYGVTEATVWSTVHECAPGDPQLVPVGRAIEGTTLHVLDRELRQVPPGEPGELFLGGAGIALGYLRRAGPTAARFGPDPYASTPGARLYRTGDLARLGPDGTLTLLGRVDNQVKIRGYRVELEEIESVIAAQPGVREAVVSVGSTAGGLEFVGAHLLADDQIDLADLRGAVEARLPDYMVPTAWRVLPELPRTPNGKVDRAALPALTSTDATREAYAPPTTETSRRLAEIWRELFELDQVGVNDDFFALGGHSLLALQLWASIEDEFEVEFALDVLFEAPTVGALAERIDAARAELMEGGP